MTSSELVADTHVQTNFATQVITDLRCCFRCICINYNVWRFIY